MIDPDIEKRMVHADIKFDNLLAKPFVHENGEDDYVCTVIDFGFMTSFGTLMNDYSATKKADGFEIRSRK